MKKTKINVNSEMFPSELAPFFAGAEVYDSHCASGAEVLYLDSGYYLKSDKAGLLEREHLMTKHFFDLGLAPEPLAYVSFSGRDYLLTRAMRGEDMTHYLDRPTLVCDRLCEAMVTLHSIPVADAPVSLALSQYRELALCEESGNYDESFLSSYFPIASREEARAIMLEYKDAFSTDTLIHGDFCLPNVMLDNGEPSGFIDLGLAGAGDRHIDVFWAVWTLAYNLGTNKYADRFLDAYGREKCDGEMLRAVAAFSSFG
jgi:kanamycin kinase